MLRRTAEEVIRVLHNKLVQRRGRRYQHSARCSAPSPRAPGALPGGSNRTRITRHHRGIELTDVDSEFQSVCCNYAAYTALTQAALDFAPVPGQISSARPAHGFRLSRLRTVGLLQIGKQNFGVQPAKIGRA